MITRDEIQQIADSVNYNVSGVKTLIEQKPSLQSAIETYKEQITEKTERISFLADTKAYYIKAVDIMYEESIGALRETLNTALQYIIFDKNYTCELELEDKRGAKNLYIYIKDDDEGFDVDMKDGVGQGIRAIISFILKAYYLINQNSRILFLDEKYSALSSQYVDRFFEFIKKFCDENDFIIVLITHDERFMNFADRTYLVSDGNVKLLEQDEIETLEPEEE